MPKQEYKILGFHGGIHDNSDAKDIRDIDLREADGVSTHKIGRLVGIGNKDTAILSSAAADIEPGYGLYYFSNDYNNANSNIPDDYLAIYDKANTKVRFYYRDKDGSSPSFLSDELVFGGAIKPNYYYADGLLRVSDTTFTQDSKWFGHIDQVLFWTNDKGNTNNLHDINKWDSGNQELKKLFSVLAENIKLVDMKDASPSASDVTSNKGSIILGYRTSEGGEWNGNYIFGVTPVFLGNQEGEISTIYSDALLLTEDSIPLYNNQITFQVFIGNGTSSSVSGNHVLQDSRIIGLNFYFKEQGEEDWIFLMHTDLREGGKHFWKLYNATTETNYGLWDGEITYDISNNEVVTDGIDIMTSATTSNHHLNFSDNNDGTGTDWEDSGNSGKADLTDHEGLSYSNVYLKIRLNNNNINGFDNRYGFLRVWGGAVSPIYVGGAYNGSTDVKIPLKTGQSGTPGTDWDTYYVPMTLPGPGTKREFRVQLLDENFNVVADSGIETMTIVDSGKVLADNYDTDQQDREY
jgi:hypothetical protein